jgi:hypothetical protein
MAHSRTVEAAAMLMIGDGVLAAIAPTRHSLLWTTSGRFGQLVHWFTERPQFVRTLGLLGVAAGVYLANRQWSALAHERHSF